MTDPSPDLSWLTARPIAHRGFHAVGGVGRGRENTPTAFRAGVEAGFAIELDVQLSADGEAMVHHDATLDRLTGETGPVLARDADALGRIEVGGDPIATLPQVMAIVADAVPLVVEVKAETLDDADAERLTDRTVALARHYRGRVAPMSFDHRVLRRCIELGAPCGLTAEGATDAAFARHAMVADGAAFLSYAVDHLPNPFVAAFRASGRPVITWTVRTPAQVAATRAHADQMTFEGIHPPAVLDPPASDVTQV